MTRGKDRTGLTEYRLNEFQRAAVLDEGRAALVSACVGSGKTTVLTEKVRYLHEVKGIPFEQMMVMTFTNRAADEIRERLDAGQKEDFRYFGTFHSIAYRLLKEFLPVEELGRTTAFEILLPEEELVLAEKLIAEHQLNIKYKNRLEQRLKNERTAYESGKTARYKDDLFRLYPLMEAAKKQLDRMTYDDLIQGAVKLLRETPVCPKWLIVDEIQDCSEEQVELLKVLFGEETSLFAVGDPNQMIYSFRGSRENLFYRVKHEFGAREYDLPVNYRSSEVILEAASRFRQYGGKLIAAQKDDDVTEQAEKIRIRSCYDPLQEAMYIAQRARELHSAGVDFNRIAVLYRVKEQADILEKTLQREGIPVVSSSEGEERDADADGLQLMTLHASKGLEFDTVFILSVNAGLIPMAGTDFESREEEMRLFFVGMTRAIKRLELTYVQSPAVPRVSGKPSSFLYMIPEKLTDWPGHRTDEEKTRNLQQLRRQVREQAELDTALQAPEQPESQPGQPMQGQQVSESQPGPQRPGQQVPESQPGQPMQGPTGERRACHAKYGIGRILREDETVIEVEFEGYGKKEFLKAFEKLDYVECP